MKYIVPDESYRGLSGAIRFSPKQTKLPVTICTCEVASFNEPDEEYVEYTPHILVATNYEQLGMFNELYKTKAVAVIIETGEFVGDSGILSEYDKNIISKWTVENKHWLHGIWHMEIDTDDFEEFLRNKNE